MISKRFVLDALTDQMHYNLDHNNGLLIKEDLRIAQVFVKDRGTRELIYSTMSKIKSNLLDEDVIGQVSQLINKL